MKIVSLFILISLLGSPQRSIAQNTYSLPLQKSLLRDLKLETEIEIFSRELRASRKGEYRVEDGRRILDLCVDNCYCFARELDKIVMSRYGYKTTLVRLRPKAKLSMVEVADGRSFHYHYVVLIEDDTRAAVIDPVVFFNTRAIDARTWIRRFDNFILSAPFDLPKE